MAPLLLAAATSLAQVSGVVTDESTGEALLAATVLVEGSAVGDVTDFDGNYRLTQLTPGTRTLIFSYIGYASEEVTFDYVEGEEYTFDVGLAPAGFTTETVTVTGQRQGQNAAINQQVKSNQLVNVVSAERIRELPDENAAESVGRLPGVNVSRSGGEGQRVNIRGLSPKFSSVNLDGVRIPATGQGRQVFNIRGGGGGNTVSPSVDDRSVDLSMISSEALSGIEVYKSLTPEQDGDAIGGSVNFVSAKAPRTERYMVNALAGHNFYHDTYDNVKVNGTYSRRFAGERLGLVGTGGFSQIDRSSDNANVTYIFPGEVVLDGVSLNDNTTDRRRYNGSLALDYELVPGHELFLTGLYARTTVEDEFRGVNLRTRVENASVYAGRNESNIDLANVSLGGRHTFGGFTADWKGTFIQTTDENPVNFSYGFGDNNPLSGSFIPLTDPYAAVDSFRWDPAVLNGGAPGGGAMTRREDRNLVAQVNLRRDVAFDRLDVAGHLKAGGKLRSKVRTRRQTGNSFLIGADYNAAYAAAFPEQPFVRQGPPGAPWVDPGGALPDFFDSQFPMPLTLRPEGAEELFGMFRGLRYDNLNPGTQDYTAEEDIWAGYLLADLTYARRLTMNVGVRYEYSDNDYVANLLNDYGETVLGDRVVTTGRINERTSGQEYGQWLPMLNLKYGLVRNPDNSNGVDLRLAATKGLTRPDYYNLTPFFSLNPGGRTISRSEPDLRPTVAWNYDAFVTAYSSRLGLLSVGGFYKELDDIDFFYGRLVPAEQIQERFGEEFGLDQAFTVVEPINAPATTFVRGLEVEVQTSLSYLPSPLDGIVLYGNYSYISSTAKYPRTYSILDPVTFRTTTFDSTRTGTMPGQSSHIANVALGYEKGKFSGRISYNYQGRSINFVSAREELDVYTDDYARVDASATYKLTPLLTLQANATNLLNRFDRTTVGTDDFLGSSSIYGTIAWLGVRFTGFGRGTD